MTFKVAIVGAGPVGLTLAIALGQRGVACVVLERNAAPGLLPKMERSNTRTMEMYRRLGLADRVRAMGFPPDEPMDVFLGDVQLTEPPLVRLEYPSVREVEGHRRPHARWVAAARAVSAGLAVRARAGAPRRGARDPVGDGAHGARGDGAERRRPGGDAHGGAEPRELPPRA